MAIAAVAVAATTAAASAGASAAANSDQQAGLKNAQQAANQYNQAARDSYTDGNLRANSYLAPYSGAGAGVLAKWAIQDGNTGIPARPDKAQFKRSDGSLDVNAYRAADNRWLSYTAAMAQKLGIPPPPQLPDTRNLSQKNRALANQQFKQQQAAWAAQVNGPGATPAAPVRGAKESDHSFAKRMKQYVNKELIPWAKTAGVGNDVIQKITSAAGNINFKTVRGSDATNQLNQVVSDLGKFGQNKVAEINQQRADAVTAAQSPTNPYAKTVTDEESWKESGDPSYIGPVNTLEDLQKIPGYQFGLDQATQNIQQSAAARGNLASGGALKELSKFTADYASGQWANLWQMRNQAFNQAAGRSMQGAGMANQMDLAKVGLAANADTAQANNTFNTGLNVGNNYQNTANVNAGIETGKGDANAAQSQGIANGILNGVSMGAGIYGATQSPKTSSTTPSFAEWMKNRNANSSTRVG